MNEMLKKKKGKKKKSFGFVSKSPEDLGEYFQSRRIWISPCVESRLRWGYSFHLVAVRIKSDKVTKTSERLKNKNKKTLKYLSMQDLRGKSRWAYVWADLGILILHAFWYWKLAKYGDFFFSVQSIPNWKPHVNWTITVFHLRRV